MGLENLLRMVRWVRWHCPPDTGFEIKTLLGHGGSPQYWVLRVDGEETFLLLSNRWSQGSVRYEKKAHSRAYYWSCFMTVGGGSDDIVEYPLVTRCIVEPPSLAYNEQWTMAGFKPCERIVFQFTKPGRIVSTRDIRHRYGRPALGFFIFIFFWRYNNIDYITSPLWNSLHNNYLVCYASYVRVMSIPSCFFKVIPAGTERYFHVEYTLVMWIPRGIHAANVDSTWKCRSVPAGIVYSELFPMWHNTVSSAFLDRIVYSI